MVIETCHYFNSLQGSSPELVQETPNITAVAIQSEAELGCTGISHWGGGRTDIFTVVRLGEIQGQ